MKPHANAVMHNSLTLSWWLGEFWPKWTKKRISPPGVEPAEFTGAPRLNLFRRRFIPEGACIHESVFNRLRLLPNYAPGNLPRVYQLESEPELTPYPIHLEREQVIIAGIHARPKWNDTTLELRKGERHLFQASGRWNDANILSSPAGYKSPSLLFRLVQRLRRAPDANWFALIGTIGKNESKAFIIGENYRLEVGEDGVLYCFANDLPFMYANNSGVVSMKVTRLE